MEEKNDCKKLELVKAYQENLKILILMILTIGAGIGAVIFKENVNEILKNSLLTALGTAFTILSLLAIGKYIKIRKLLKEVEKEWKQ